MAIRKAKEEDLGRISEIERGAFPTPWPVGLLKRYLGDDGFMVYEQDGETIGYILVGLRFPSLMARLERRTKKLLKGFRGVEPNLQVRIGHVMNLAIDPNFRRQGIGRELLCQGLEYLQSLGAGAVELEVRTQNEEAVNLYKRFGFLVKKKIKRYYSNGDDAYLMEKVLNPVDRTPGRDGSRRTA